MIKLEVSFEEVSKAHKELKIKMNSGLQLNISDDDGKILSVICSKQPETTAMRINIQGKMKVEIFGDGWMQSETVEHGSVIIKRI